MEKIISFAVPCYNSAEYMSKCVESLLKAGEDAEIILVNDGSTKDNTKDIADEYAVKYPTIVKAIHQENGGHGQAVNTGLKNATGKYFKVVDSDDWVDECALKKLIETLKGFSEEQLPDAVFLNYVYEYTATGKQRVVKYKGKMPEGRLFTFDEMKPLGTGNFLAMHSVVYRKEVLTACDLVLPKHTFYVDNIFVYKPLPTLKKLYYINADFYRYFIGRVDQSVNESVIMKRIDQHIRVTDILIDCHDLNQVKLQSKKLYKYMVEFINIMMVINSIYLIKIGDEESFNKKQALWDRLKQTDLVLYKKCKKRFTGMVASNNKFVCGICKFIYVIVRKIFKFN